MSSLNPLHSTRRPEPLKDTDYDHEILLLDHTLSAAAARTRSHSESHIERGKSLSPGDTPVRRLSDDQRGKRWSLRAELTKMKYSKYQDRGEYGLNGVETPSEGGPATPVEESHGEEASLRIRDSKQYKRRRSERESVIDILYENQRGCFLCKRALFSAKALGCADVAPWTTVVHKPSATNITNAQVPDPTWEWAWKTWTVNHSDRADEDGWEYSFVFSKNFSWHKPRWWNSFVRRRAWTRMRVRRNQDDLIQDPNTFSSDYFTVPPSRVPSRVPSQTPSRAESPYGRGPSIDGRPSIGQAEKSDTMNKGDIYDIDHLMDALKHSRIDREKTEAIENFMRNGGEGLACLKERMHEIMSRFVFQASRRHLLVHLISILDEASKLREERAREGVEEDPAETRRIDNLAAAIEAAEEEVKRLEYWSDIKSVAENDFKGDVTQSRSWDSSGPKDATPDGGLREVHEGEDPAASGKAGIAGCSLADKGKGRA